VLILLRYENSVCGEKRERKRIINDLGVGIFFLSHTFSTYLEGHRVNKDRIENVDYCLSRTIGQTQSTEKLMRDLDAGNVCVFIRINI
jgi:hypothetical protein